MSKVIKMNKKEFQYCADFITANGEEFRIKANSDTIKIFPRSSNFSFNTFMKIYKIIVETIDSKAEFIVKGSEWNEYMSKL